MHSLKLLAFSSCPITLAKIYAFFSTFNTLCVFNLISCQSSSNPLAPSRDHRGPHYGSPFRALDPSPAPPHQPPLPSCPPRGPRLSTATHLHNLKLPPPHPQNLCRLP